MLVDGVRGDQVSALDRGLQYGDGLFETLAVIDGRIPLWERHMDRLELGCRRLGLVMPSPHTLREEVLTVTGHDARVVAKILVTRGVGSRGYSPPQPARQSRIVYAASWPTYPPQWLDEGVAITVCETTARRGKALAGIKHLNRLEHVMARYEWREASIAEGLMLDDDGRVIEATAANLFGVRAGILYTPSLDFAGVCGVVREEVLTLAARAGYVCRVQDLYLTDIFQMDELFLTNSIIGLWPVTSCLGAPRRFRTGAQTMGAQLCDSLFRQGLTWLKPKSAV